MHLLYIKKNGAPKIRNFRKLLSITRINSKRTQAKLSVQGSYLFYLGSPSTRERGDFDDYARGAQLNGPAPFWAGSGPALWGLQGVAQSEQVERLAQGFHPLTGEPLLRGAGGTHVMGVDMTFSAPKDVSAVFAGADAATQEAIIEALQASAKAAIAHTESVSITRHGHGGRAKQAAEAIAAAIYTHFASRALDPQLHAHAFVFNLGKRPGSEWSALDGKPHFDAKMSTGALFRAELAWRLRGLGFAIEPDGSYFKIAGIVDGQRDALSTRSREINSYLSERGGAELDGAAAREVAALNTRSAKAEPPLPELLARFKAQAARLGLTPALISAWRSAKAPEMDTPDISHAALLDELTASSSVATPHEALALICEKAMGQWGAARCLQELKAFMAGALVMHLGSTEHLTQVFTSKAMIDLEADISAKVEAGKGSIAHQLPREAVELAFETLERDLTAKVGSAVKLDQQRAAALHICCETGSHAFIEGWAGTGKTTMLKTVGAAYREAGVEPIGCCQSAAAAQNLSRETGIRSRTIASLLLSIKKGRVRLSVKSAVILDEAGMVGSREFGLLQAEALKAGAKLICVGDPKQLQPIGAGGIFKALMERHGKAELSAIQRQRTDQGPLLDWILSRKAARALTLPKERLSAIKGLPEEARMPALDALAESDPKLGRALARWRARFDHEWMREAVAQLARGEAESALRRMDERGRLRLISGAQATLDALISDWDRDKTDLKAKALIAATRAEARALNAMARERLIERGVVVSRESIKVAVLDRDGNAEAREFAPGDRIAFTQNDKPLGVVNGGAGEVRAISIGPAGEPLLKVELDDRNARGESTVMIPVSFGRFDHAYCLTNHKSQGRTFDSAYVLLNPATVDREWSYVAGSRSRFATTLYASMEGIRPLDPDAHHQKAPELTRDDLISALASRMRRSRAKGTTLEWDAPNPPTSISGRFDLLARWAKSLVIRSRERAIRQEPGPAR